MKNMNKEDKTFAEPCFPKTAELLDTLAPPRGEWKRKVRDAGSKFSAAFIAPIDCIDSEQQPFLDCHCRDDEHLRYNITHFLSHGFHPVVIISKGKSLSMKEIDFLKLEKSTFCILRSTFSKEILSISDCREENSGQKLLKPCI